MTKHLIRKTEQMRAERDCETKLNLETVTEIYNGWVIADLRICTNSLQALRLSNCSAAWPRPCHPFLSVTYKIIYLT